MSALRLVEPNYPFEVLSIEGITYGTHALQFYDAGVRGLVPVRPNTKAAIGGWSSIKGEQTREQVEEYAAKYPGHSIGVVSGNGLAFFDSDVTDEAAATIVDEIFIRHCGHTPLVRIGNYPKQTYVYNAPDIKFLKHPYGLPIEIFGKPTNNSRFSSGQTLIAGIHEKTLRPYIYKGGEGFYHITDLKSVDDLPGLDQENLNAALYEISEHPELQHLKKKATLNGRLSIGQDGITVDTAAQLFAKEGEAGLTEWVSIAEEGTRHVTCLMTMAFLHGVEYVDAVYNCHPATLTLEQVSERDELIERVKQAFLDSKPNGESELERIIDWVEDCVEGKLIEEHREIIGGFDIITADEDGAALVTRASLNWIMESKNKISGCHSNVASYLRHCDEYTIRYDAFKERVLINGMPMSDYDLDVMREGFERRVQRGTGENNIYSAVRSLANENKFDSLNDYIDSLPDWQEGDTDHIGKFCELLTLKQEIEHVFVRRHLVGCVARAIRPGCKMDTALILYSSEQGKRKSTLIRELCPDPQLFDDNISGRLSNKDELSKLSGRWLIELGELSSLSKSNVEIAKQFMSRQIDAYRVPYGRIVEDHPRRCGIFGTTNIQRALSDETGNRRYWPINVEAHEGEATDWLGETDSDGITNRDRLWSQARAILQTENRWWLTEEEELLQREVALLHKKNTIVYDYLEEWWEDSSGCFKREGSSNFDGHDWAQHRLLDDDRLHYVSALEVDKQLSMVLRSSPGPQQVSDELRRLGWVKYPIETEGQVKPPQFKFRHEGKLIAAPRGFASPEFHAALDGKPKAEVGRSIHAEIHATSEGY